MSEPVPPRGGRGRTFGGLPLWGWGVIAAAGLGTIVFLRLRRGSSAAGAATAAPPADQQIGLTQYEQITSQLTGIEGTDQALLAAIKDLQGDRSERGDHDKDDRDNDRRPDNDRDDLRKGGVASGEGRGGGGDTGPPVRRPTRHRPPRRVAA